MHFVQREEEELRKVEDWKAAELKRRSQLEMKNMLDQTLKVKRIIQARQAQEELAFDLKILEELLKQAKIEESEHEQRKVWKAS
jgi:cilia- and flagella-associated protein 53